MTAISTSETIEELPVPHRCPWIIHYFLASPIRRLLEPPQKLVGDSLKEGMTVLDVGCGFGYLSVPMARMVGPTGRVISVDVEPRVMERLKKRAQKANVADRITTHVCQPTELGLQEYEGQVDLIAIINTLHELDNLAGFLAEARRLLKPSGRMLMIEPKGHLTPEQFAAELEMCRRAGFREVESSKGKHRRALLAPA